MIARRACGLAGSATLAACSLLHLYWMGSGRRGTNRVIPTADGRPRFVPGAAATATVAAALAAAAALYAGAGLQRRPRWLFRTGTLGAATILSVRAVGDRRQLGFTKTERDTDFARLDTTVLAPLCTLLAIAGYIAATPPRVDARRGA